METSTDVLWAECLEISHAAFDGAPLIRLERTVEGGAEVSLRTEYILSTGSGPDLLAAFTALRDDLARRAKCRRAEITKLVGGGESL